MDAIAAKFAKLSRHQPVSSGHMHRWLMVGQKPWKTFDGWVEGVSVLNSWVALFLVALFVGVSIVCEALSRLGMPQAGLTAVLAGIGIPSLLFALRMVLVSWWWGRVSLHQMQEIAGWMGASPALSKAVSTWLRPGMNLHEGDYRAIRHAAAYELRYAHGSTIAPRTTVIQWAGSLGRLRSSPRQSHVNLQESRSALQEAQQKSKAWVQNQWALSPATTWPQRLTAKEQQALLDLEAWRKDVDAHPRPLSDAQALAWGNRIHLDMAPVPRGREGFSLSVALWRSTAWRGGVEFFRFASLAWVAGSMGKFFFRTLVEGKKDGTPEGGMGLLSEFNFWVFEKVSSVLLWVWDHVGWIGLGFAVFAMLVVAISDLALRKVAQIWWSLPLSERGFQELERLVEAFPQTRGPMLRFADPAWLTQADLAFVRRASHVLRRLRQEDLAFSDLQLRDEALESLPALQEYRARELAKRLESSFAQAPPAVRPRF